MAPQPSSAIVSSGASSRTFTALDSWTTASCAKEETEDWWLIRCPSRLSRLVPSSRLPRWALAILRSQLLKRPALHAPQPPQ